jgi:hypothetical protein
MKPNVISYAVDSTERQQNGEPSPLRSQSPRPVARKEPYRRPLAIKAAQP